MSPRRRNQQQEIDRQLSRWSKRRVLSWSLFVTAVIIAGQHLLAHAGWRPLPMSMGWQDIVVGYPTALVLGIAGAIAMDPNPPL